MDHTTCTCRISRLLLIAVAASLMGINLLDAQTAGKRYAVLVGINEYLDPGILKLGTARNDAKDLGDALAKAGWDKAFVMSDDTDARNADFPTRGNIERRISLLAELASPADTIMLFFSGHGLVEGNSELFLPVDADSTRLGSSALRLADQTKAFTDKGITKVILAVDACRESLNKSKGLSVVGIGGGAGLAPTPMVRPMSFTPPGPVGSVTRIVMVAMACSPVSCWLDWEEPLPVQPVDSGTLSPSPTWPHGCLMRWVVIRSTGDCAKNRLCWNCAKIAPAWFCPKRLSTLAR